MPTEIGSSTTSSRLLAPDLGNDHPSRDGWRTRGGRETARAATSPVDQAIGGRNGGSCARVQASPRVRPRGRCGDERPGQWTSSRTARPPRAGRYSTRIGAPSGCTRARAPGRRGRPDRHRCARGGPRRRVMHYGLGGLADGGDHALDEEEDEEEAQADREGIAIPFRDQSGWIRVMERRRGESSSRRRPRRGRRATGRSRRREGRPRSCQSERRRDPPSRQH